MRKAFRPHIDDEILAVFPNGIELSLRTDGVEEEVQFTKRKLQTDYQPIDPATGKLTVVPEPAPGQPPLPEGVSAGDPVYQKRLIDEEIFDAATRAQIETVLAAHDPNAWFKIESKRQIDDEVDARIERSFNRKRRDIAHERATELLDKGKGQLNAAENAELAEIRAGNSWIRSVRAHGESLKTQVDGMTDTEAEAFDPKVDPGWPTPPPET